MKQQSPRNDLCACRIAKQSAPKALIEDIVTFNCVGRHGIVEAEDDVLGKYPSK